MRTPCCHTCLAFVLKFLIFLQAFVGVAIIVCSAYMLNQWQHHHNQAPSPGGFRSLNFASGELFFQDDALSFNSVSLPAPWFIYAFMGVGILICCIALIGHIGAEAINGCCLCCYAVLATIFILLQLGLVTFIALDHQWEKDIPFDPTGQLDSLRKFIQDNVDVFMWVGIAIITIQVLSILLSIVLRSLVSRPRADDDIEEDYSFRTGAREPLLSPYSGQASGSTRGDSDIWSSRMRAKYGLSGGDAKQSTQNQSMTTDVKP
ncbi:tetraspanin-18 [Andrographis paniculata]|uniref:tetraspanin-18 n=1 Tax=Andrographis paniculata TaxID=175694 RepID=UPI0021E83B8B|nr:tetraspanin-18 [Andrographis paniculata]